MQKINNETYDSFGEKWYSGQDHPVALLRAESNLRNPWVLEKINQKFGSRRANILDVACGGGLLSNMLGKAGHRVTGVDLSEDSLKTARAHDSTRTVTYAKADAYKLPFDNEFFEVVCAMDFLEHIDDPQKAIFEMSRVLKPEGLFFFHTFNRNWMSGFFAIKFMEWFIKNTPKNLHMYHLFITPDELRKYCGNANLSVQEMIGLKPVVDSWSTVSEFLRGKVPENFQFAFTRSLRVGYSGFANKLPAS